MGRKAHPNRSQPTKPGGAHGHRRRRRSPSSSRLTFHGQHLCPIGCVRKHPTGDICVEGQRRKDISAAVKNATLDLGLQLPIRKGTAAWFGTAQKKFNILKVDADAAVIPSRVSLLKPPRLKPTWRSACLRRMSRTPALHAPRAGEALKEMRSRRHRGAEQRNSGLQCLQGPLPFARQEQIRLGKHYTGRGVTKF